MHPTTVAFILLVLAAHGIRKKSLSISGAVAACIIGAPILAHPSIIFSAVLLTFYLSSSRLTKYRSDIKKRIEMDHREGGQRTAIQVLSNGLTGAIACILHWYLISTASSGSTPTKALGYTDHQWIRCMLYAFISHFACCNGDTWASELGVLSKSNPILITTWKSVPRGTNGGISAFGTMAATLGGLVIGIISAMTAYIQNNITGSSETSQSPWITMMKNAGLSRLGTPFTTTEYRDLVLLGLASGVIGSMIDSMIGATLQLTVVHKPSGRIMTTVPPSPTNHKSTDTAKPVDQTTNNNLRNRNVNKKNDDDETKDGDEYVVISGRDVLDNHQVNFFSSLVCAIVAGYMGLVSSS